MPSLIETGFVRSVVISQEQVLKKVGPAGSLNPLLIQQG